MRRKNKMEHNQDAEIAILREQLAKALEALRPSSQRSEI